MLFTFNEIIDVLIMTFGVGFIFMDLFDHRQFNKPEDYLKIKSGFAWDRLFFASGIVAPAIILHELGHKFVALAFGFQATFQAAYAFLLLGVVLKLVRSPFIFFVPAYVLISGLGNEAQFGITAFAGPFVNLVLWGVSWSSFKFLKLKKKTAYAFALSAKINMFLFIFNMLPIPGFDGSKVWSVIF